MDVSALILVAVEVEVEVEVNANQRRFPEKLDQVFGLVGAASELEILLIGDHDDAFFALPGNALWAFRSG